jgi:hypothetical protein
VAFLGTRAGYLLVTRSILWSEIEADRMLDGMASSAFWRCQAR